MKKGQKKAETILTHGGRHLSEQHGFVNTPVTRGSTVLFPTLEAMRDPSVRYRYGRTGNPSTRAVEEVVTELEGAAGTVLTPSGLNAIATALMSCLNSGDELLMTDSAYEPTRKFCNGILARMGITIRYYDPRIGGGISALFSEKTRAVFTESPGSLTFEVQDLPAIAEAAHARDITVLTDNSWATPLFYQPLELGADIVIHAGTKMFIGHSDAMFGTISAKEKHLPSIKETHRLSGTCASPDDAFLAARGLRTLSVRMKEHQARALELASWLEERDEVLSVLHPALPMHPDHELFKRDFSGSGSLFAFLLPEAPDSALAAMLDNFELFGMGYSWGGYESLAVHAFLGDRVVATAPTEGPVLRLQIGLEDVADLKADIERGLRAAAEA